MIPDTSTRQQIVGFIRQHLKDKGYPPTVREIGQAVGLSSSSTVHVHLRRLVRDGFIEIDPIKPRAIRLLSPTDTDNEGKTSNDATYGVRS